MKTVSLEVKAGVGDQIKVLPLDLKTTVLGIWIGPGGRIKYQIEYFNNGVRQDAYLYDYEFEIL